MPTAYITVPVDEADELARALVEERLAACVNAVECNSVYRWRGEIHDDEEKILFAKTTDERYDDLQTYVERHHPAEVPCIERFDEDDELSAFAEWCDGSVGTDEERS
ncbi:divalent-cation tolerance protein CutA [Halospeciosus flavus]|uniref:Divalent-cation tolerance protein CutA n=1 Tax=Halospeciosus flavus TaxID=3032283 RepID=A0ABD5Z3N0_9EURY|nr:divalent-cation tolerance protein CutA [Halospeciosus flavus]